MERRGKGPAPDCPFELPRWGLLLARLSLLSLAALWAASPGNAEARPAAQAGSNLLANPGFEGPYVKQCCHTEPEMEGRLIDEIQVAPGWLAWWYPPGIDAAHPEYCGDDTPPECQAWHRPEWREAAPFGERIRQGGNAQKYFTFWSVHQAGMYQQVTGLAPGARLRFSVYMHAWSTNDDAPYSSGQVYMGMKVGIDPTGGLNPWSPDIVWSEVHDAYDHYQEYTVETVAQGEAVTVYTHSQPLLGYKHNDVYVDDASLVIVGGQPAAVVAAPTQASPTGAPATTAPTAAPATPTPATEVAGAAAGPEAFPPGSETYTVEPGDALWTIAARAGMTVDELRALNNITGNNIFAGQVLLLRPAAPPPPTSTVEAPPPTTAPTVVAAAPSRPQLAGVPGTLCITVFGDSAADGQRDAEDELEPPPPLSLALLRLEAGQEQAVGGFRSGESVEAQCFPDLQPASYRLALTTPSGYVVTTAPRTELAILPGDQIYLEIGLAPQAAATKHGDRRQQVALAGGILAALLAAYGGLMFAYRRGLVGRRSAPNGKGR
jgi:LysM repeat protein